MNVSDAIRQKRAVREFSSQPLSEEAVRAILNAGRRAQSSKNTQTWQFIAIRERELLKQLSTYGDYAGHLAGAALGVLIATEPPAKRYSVFFDAGQAAAYMQLAAWELGIGSCIATIYEPEKAAKLLGIPKEYEGRMGISFGYPKEAAAISAPPKLGGRRKLDEVVHWEKW
jgi:nitroreductase